MFKTPKSLSVNLSLGAAIHRLQENHFVDSVLIMGSEATGTASAHSDYDIAVVLSEHPAKTPSTFTYIDRKPADIFYFSLKEIRVLLRAKKPGPDDRHHWLLSWLKDGNIAFDRSGTLSRLQAVARRTRVGVTRTTKYAMWYKINHNLVQNTRYYNSKDKAYLEALDIRLPYSAVEALCGYFTLRGLPWHGEKAAVQFLRKHDPSYFRLFQKCVNSHKRDEKYRLYRKLVIRTIPRDKVWNTNVTLDSLESRNGFWNGLLR